MILKGGGYVTRKRLEQIGKTPDDVKNMTPAEQTPTPPKEEEQLQEQDK